MMAPNPQEFTSMRQGHLTESKLDDNRVVISGMSGLYPRSRNVKEFADILYNKVNPVTQDDLRYKFNHPEVMQHAGTIPELGYFDAQFFKVHYRLALSMDPMSRKILEQTYQAIYDAGCNPEQFSGKKVGVYIGSCMSETENGAFYEDASKFGFCVLGCNRSMFANRISYWLNAKGPSMSINDACCSSTTALEQAYSAMKRGECEAAVVGGCYISLHPQSSVHYGRIINLCSDGKTKSFDEHADGCAKSEVINVLFLQKAKDALRVYAEVLHVKTEFNSILSDATGPKYGFYRNISSTANFMNKFYEDARIPIQAIEYVEAFGCALPDADKVELQAIEEVFCRDRNDPLLVGSVMSNIGYTEAASGLTAITKVLLGYHKGALAANLHCEKPRQDIAALHQGRMRVITKHEPFRRTYVAVNGMAFTGVNSHVLLHGLYKPKDPNRYKSSIPHLVTISGRREQAVKDAFDILKMSPVDSEQLALLHNIHRTSVSGHLGRGFIILQTNEEQKTVSLCEKIAYFDDVRKPLWFVYSGMGSQWAGMGAQLMRIPLFAAAIERCDKVLAPKGLNIKTIITSPDESIFNNILNSFVGIAAIQIGLTDILEAIGLKPDGIIGHSVGELACAYADGCLTAEEMILAAYYRGLVSLETKFIRGSMAAVGMGYQEIAKICPLEIEVACHNGPASCTLSGPADVMRQFVTELMAKGIFAREVPCSNIAYHSRYIADAGPGFMKYLKETISLPKARSARWLSSSVPQDRWDEPAAKLCSPEYLTNNLLSPVLFEETSQLIPDNAVLVEVAPHGLLQAILKRSMPATCTNIPLTRRGHPDNALFLLENIGELYTEGYNSSINGLYPKVEMPVSTGTPFLSHMVKWAHDEKWPLTLYHTASRRVAANCNFNITLQDNENTYLNGHSIRGHTLYPFAASLILVWDTLAMILGMPKKQLSVKFINVQLQAQPVLHDRRQLKLSVAIQRGTGRFEVLDGNSTVITGFILSSQSYIKPNNKNENMMYFSAKDVYQLLRDRDYLYSGEFQSINAVDKSQSKAVLLWQNNWVTFIDGMLQLNALRQPHHAVSQPTRIRSICINVKEHSRNINNSEKSNDMVLMKAEVNDEMDNTRCGGVLVENIQFISLSPVNERKFALTTLTFVSNFNSELDVSSSLEVFLQIVSENVNKDVINVVGVSSQKKAGTVFEKIKMSLQNIARVKVHYKQITRESALEKYDFSNVDLVLVQNLSSDESICQQLQYILPRDTFVVNEEDREYSGITRYRVLCTHSFIQEANIDQSKLHLIRWGRSVKPSLTTTLLVRKETDLAYLTSARTNLASDHRLLIVSPYPAQPGLRELVSSWRKEAVQNKIHLVTVINGCLDDIEKKSRDAELAFNVVDHNNWGGEYYLPIPNVTTVSKNVTLQSVHSGDYDSMNWVDAPELPGSGVTVTVKYAGINNNDIKKANNSLCFKQNIELGYGSDFSGVTKKGERVMGIVSSGAVSSQVRAQPELLWPVPAHWSLEDAATVPLAYAQAFYCLGIKTKLFPGMTVLVHGGAGALGQAVISIALAYGCEVFTTVSDTRKKHFLLKLFPELKADHIGSSRDHTFADMILIATKEKGKGCDIIISCVQRYLKNATLRCTGFLGTCFDVSQLHNQENYEFGLRNLFDLKNYSTVDFSSIFTADKMDEVKTINKMLSEGIVRGYVRPLSRVTFEPSEVARAFRLLAVSQHRGRVLLRMSDTTLQAQHRLKCHENRCHLLFCSKVTFEIRFADRLVARGVKKLRLFISKQSAYLKHKIRSWQRLGVDVSIFTGNLNEQNVSDILNDCAEVGPLEGVYFTLRNEDDIISEQNIIHIESQLRKISPELRYFAAFNVGGRSIGKAVCLQRISDQLPATVLTLPDLKDGLNTDCASWRSAVDAAERALQSTSGVLLAHTERGPRPSLLQELSSLAGISLPEDDEKSLTLQELGVQNHKLQLICNFLQFQYNYAFDEEQVSQLTIAALLKLEKALLKLPYDDIRGLRTFFNYVDSDELLATTEIVFLPTLVNNYPMGDDEIVSDQTYLCIVPGMEGHYERFRELCERLKLPALVLQPGFDHPYETIKETAEKYTKVLLKRTKLENTFYLMSYESGVLVALEMAAILEGRGLTGTVFCVGCTPDELKNELEEQLADFKTEEQLQDGVLRHMYTLMAGADATELDNALRDVGTWPQKVDTCVRVLLGRVPHSAQYARALIECALARVEQARRSSGTARALRSQLVLLRAAHDAPQLTSLQQHSQRPLLVHQLSTTLAHVATDLQCAAIINQHLDPAILEDFSTRNVCDTYIS